MKKLFILLSLFAVTGMIAQKTLNEYSFVVVPEQFDFTNAKNGFELNEMSKYYLNKNGFNAFMTTEVPNVKRCDGLYADVQKEGGFIGTKLVLILKNCDGTEVYRSNQGTSKLKDFRKAYQQALREVFNDVELLKIDQQELIIYEDVAAVPKTENTQKEVIENLKPKNSVVIEDAAINSPKIDKTKTISSEVFETKTISKTPVVSSKPNISGILPDTRFSSYKVGEKVFLLRQTNTGYSLYEETSAAEDGLLLVGKISNISISNPLLFTTNLGLTGQATFDQNSNLTINLQDKTTTYTHQD